MNIWNILQFLTQSYVTETLTYVEHSEKTFTLKTKKLDWGTHESLTFNYQLKALPNKQTEDGQIAFNLLCVISTDSYSKSSTLDCYKGTSETEVMQWFRTVRKLLLKQWRVEQNRIIENNQKNLT